MKFLVDAQLPAKLCQLLQAAGHDAVHTSDLPDGNRTTESHRPQCGPRPMEHGRSGGWPVGHGAPTVPLAMGQLGRPRPFRPTTRRGGLVGPLTGSPGPSLGSRRSLRASPRSRRPGGSGRSRHRPWPARHRVQPTPLRGVSVRAVHARGLGPRRWRTGRCPRRRQGAIGPRPRRAPRREVDQQSSSSFHCVGARHRCSSGRWRCARWPVFR